MNEVVHDMRNDLAVAIATAYALMDGKLAPDRANLRDIVDALEALDVKLKAESAAARARRRAAANDDLRHFLEAAPVPAMLAKAGRIVLANGAFERLLGYGHGEMDGLSVETFVPERYRDPPLLPRDDRDLLALCKDGTERPVELRMRPMISAGDDAVLGIAFDLGERRRSEIRLLALIEAAPNAMVLVGADGCIMLVNAQTERLFGYARSELLGRSIELLIPERLRPDHVGLRRGYDAGPTARPMGAGRDLFGRRNDGEEIPIEIGLNPISLPEGEFVLASVIDITERRRAENLRVLNATMHEHNARLEALNRELENASRFKSQFVATMSHELRTPLTAIIGMVELLRTSRLDDVQRGTADSISESAEALLAIINSILDFSKMEAGKVELRTHPFGVAALVEGAAGVLAQQARDKRLDFNTYVDPAIPHVVGDADRVRQILLNLIANAVKFTESGRVDVRALLTGAADGAVTLRFEVRDTGIGIAAETLPRLFQPFVQADSSLSRAFTGTGLGLSISKRLAELMHGEIGVESEPGRGSTFWFSARFDVAEEAPAARPVFAGLDVAIVSDDETFAQVMERYLGSWGIGARRIAEPAALARFLHEAGGERTAIVDLTSATGRAAYEPLEAAGDPLVARVLAVGRTPLAKPLRQSELFDQLVRATERRRPVRLAAAGHAILVAEDNAQLRKLLGLQFAEIGARATFVGDGLEAIEALARDRFTLVFMDCHMPNLDGLQATRAIREREARTGGHVPIVAMTANAFVEDRDLCLAAGMDDYLAKPVRMDDLGKMIARWSAVP